MSNQKKCLIRYDTECAEDVMNGFFEKAIEVHRTHEIPATFFCTGKVIDEREQYFKAFHEEVGEDPLFDIQDHSYSHIGVGYETGKKIEELKLDYERSFSTHVQVLGKRPIGIAICGTSGADGKRLHGFDETKKSREEFNMLVALGMKMINTFLKDKNESTQFSNYGILGHPQIMGFPSGYSDTSWMARTEKGDPLTFILGRIDDHADRDEHLPVMLHDWVAWNRAKDKELTHVIRIAEHARKRNFELRTHVSCYRESDLWH